MAQREQESADDLLEAAAIRTEMFGLVQDPNHSIYDAEDEEPGGARREDIESLLGGGHDEEDGSGEMDEEEEEEDEEEDGFAIDGARRYRSDEAEESDRVDSGDEGADQARGGGNAHPAAKAVAADQAAAVGGLQVVSKSGKSMGVYVPKVRVPFDQAYQTMCGHTPVMTPMAMGMIYGRGRGGGGSTKRSRKEIETSGSEEEEDSTSDSASGEHRGRRGGGGDERDTNASIMTLLKAHQIPMTDEIKKALDQLSSGTIVDEVEKDSSGRPAKRARVSQRQGREGEADGEVGGGESQSASSASALNNSRQDYLNSVDSWSQKQVDEYIKEKYAEELDFSGLSYERFMQLTCPLCGFGNSQGDAIYAPKLAMIHAIANEGIMSGKLETTAVIVTFFWNKYIMKPMIRKGRKVMRLSYDMTWAHLTEPHTAEPRLDQRLDLILMNKMVRMAANDMTRMNPMTGDYTIDEKLFNRAVGAMRTKYAVRGSRPERQAFYNGDRDFGEQHAAALTSPFVNMHFGSKQLPRFKASATKGARTARATTGGWKKGGGGGEQ